MCRRNRSYSGRVAEGSADTCADELSFTTFYAKSEEPANRNRMLRIGIYVLAI